MRNNKEYWILLTNLPDLPSKGKSPQVEGRGRRCAENRCDCLLTMMRNTELLTESTLRGRNGYVDNSRIATVSPAVWQTELAADKSGAV